MNTWDQHYTITKDIVLKKKSIKPEFTPIITWFKNTYAIELATIIFELVTYPNHQIKTPIPSLSIVFKANKDFKTFHDNHILLSDIETKQVISKKFRAVLQAQGLRQENVLNKSNNTTESNKNVEESAVVHFHDFQYLEQRFVKRNVPKAKIDALLDKINNKAIYTITNNYSGVTIILYTEAQVTKLQNSEQFKKWVDLFFELIQAHNQLVYFKRESLIITLNSKERMDKNSFGELSNYR